MALSNVVWMDWELIDEKIDWESKYDSSYVDEDYSDPFIPLLINRAESDLCSGQLAYHDGYPPEYKPQPRVVWSRFDLHIDTWLE